MPTIALQPIVSIAQICLACKSWHRFSTQNITYLVSSDPCCFWEQRLYLWCLTVQTLLFLFWQLLCIHKFVSLDKLLLRWLLVQGSAVQWHQSAWAQRQSVLCTAKEDMSLVVMYRMHSTVRSELVCYWHHTLLVHCRFEAWRRTSVLEEEQYGSCSCWQYHSHPSILATLNFKGNPNAWTDP